MPKTYTPIHLKNYDILTPGITHKQITQELKELSQWLKTNQDDYYNNHFDSIIEQIIGNGEKPSGSTNSFGRKLGIEPSTQAGYQPYNYAEMFRASVVSKIAGYLQNELLFNVINSFDKAVGELSARDVIDRFRVEYPQFSVPKVQFAVRALDRLSRLGTVHGKPRDDGVLYFWASDTHFSKVTVNGHFIYFTYKSGVVGGKVTLKFRLPRGERFVVGVGDKVTRPNVRVDSSGVVWFDFTIQGSVDSAVRSSDLGFLLVDLGLVELWTGTVLTPDGGFSSPFFANHYANYLGKKIDRLWVNWESCVDKAVVCEANGRVVKAEVLRVEAGRIRAKISRLKLERAHSIGSQIVGVAEAYGVGICFEDLSWVPNSKWEQSLQQSVTVEKAVRKRIYTRKVNPKNTSQRCPWCGGRVSHDSATRVAKCVNVKCSRMLGRDVLASRNMGLKVFRWKSFVSAKTRLSRPVVTGYKPGLPNKVFKKNNLYSEAG